MKILKSKDQELQCNVAVKEKLCKRKKLLDDLLDQQRAYLTASSNANMAPSKSNADDESSSNLTSKSKGDVDDDTDDDFNPDFRRAFNVQKNVIPPIVDNSRSLAVQDDYDSTLNSSY